MQKIRLPRQCAVVGVVVSLTIAPSAVGAREIYVDHQLGENCDTYDPGSRSCGPGSDLGRRSLEEGAAAAESGDVVLLREGTYDEVLEPPTSGAAGSPIVYRAYDGERPVIANVDEPAIAVTGRSYIEIEGLLVQDVLGWGRIEDSDHIVFRDMTFESATATGTTGGLKFVRSTQCLVTGSTIEDGNDNLLLQESDRNVISGNVFVRGRHSLLSVRCGNFNVIRDNTFSNPDQKSIEIFDCEGVSDAPVRLDATHRNVIESNRFELTQESDRDYRYNAIQYAGQNGIVRRNVFYDNEGGGLAFQVYPDEALHNYGHRAYNNTFFNNRCYGIIGSDDTSDVFGDNIVANNLLYLNVGCAGEPEQTNVRNTGAVTLDTNAIVDESPGFVDEDARDLRLTEGSVAIDAGRFVTTAAGAGSGIELHVADASYFFDGNGIDGEPGDLIQLEGATTTARVVEVDVEADLLRLDAALEWTDGQGVGLRYAGEGPDMGAFEYELDDEPPVEDAGPDGGRPDGPDADMHSDDAGNNDSGPIQPDGGVSDGGAPGNEDEGCSCRAGGGNGAPLFISLVMLVLIFTGRARR